MCYSGARADIVKYLLLATVVYLHTAPVVYPQHEPVSSMHATVCMHTSYRATLRRECDWILSRNVAAALSLIRKFRLGDPRRSCLHKSVQMKFNQIIKSSERFAVELEAWDLNFCAQRISTHADGHVRVKRFLRYFSVHAQSPGCNLQRIAIPEEAGMLSGLCKFYFTLTFIFRFSISNKCAHRVAPGDVLQADTEAIT